MKPLVTAALAALLLSANGCSKRPALEQARAATPPGPAPQVARAIIEHAALPDPAPADVEPESAPSAEEVAAFHAPVPK